MRAISAKPPQMALEGKSRFRLLYPLSKVVAVLIGGPLTVLAIMVALGLLFEHGWVRLAIAVVVAIATPLVIAERVLPKDDPLKGRGVPSEITSVFFALVPLLFFGVFAAQTRGWTRSEGARQSAGVWPGLATVPFFLSQTDVRHPPPRTNARTAEPVSGGIVEDHDRHAPVEPAHDAGPTDAGRTDLEEDAGQPLQEPPAAEELTSAELFARWAPSVVSIAVGHGGGTGFIVDQDGTIATNHHVLGDTPGNVKVKLQGNLYADEVWFLWSDAEADLALIRVRTDAELAPVQLSDSDSVQVGERAVSIGNPLGLEHTLTEGIVSARRVFRGRRMIQMSTPISPGNSGGPLFRGNGEVLGMTTATLGFAIAQNLNLAIPINELKEALTQSHPEARKIGGGTATQGGTW